MAASKSEIHLFLLWQHARVRESAILGDLSRELVVRDAVEIEWTRSAFSRNLTRFYGDTIPRWSRKEKHCGTGPMLLLVVEDRAPAYEERPFRGDIRRVNSRLFDLKARYRDWTGGGHRVHATVDPAETEHDLLLLLGRPTESYRNGTEWDGHVRRHAHDLAGSEGRWESVELMLQTVGATMSYVVLYAGDESPVEVPRVKDRGRLELLAEDLWWVEVITDARRAARRAPLYEVSVGGRPLLLSLRSVGDGYLDGRWSSELLGRRQTVGAGVFAAAPEDRFYALLYHVFAHGLQPLPDAGTALREHAIGELKLVDWSDEARWSLHLEQFLAPRGYSYPAPADPSLVLRPELVARATGPHRRRWRRRARQAHAR